MILHGIAGGFIAFWIMILVLPVVTAVLMVPCALLMGLRDVLCAVLGLRRFLPKHPRCVCRGVEQALRRGRRVVK